jgi:4a-hydroxytetrahydrobiopterin dehydratase
VLGLFYFADMLDTNWITRDNALVKTFVFDDFVAALAFVQRVGELAELAQHHPEITINYNKVLLRLQTHDAGNVVTQKDEDLAVAIDQL